MAWSISYMGFPCRAVAACLEHLGAKPEDVTQVAYGSRSGPVDHCPREEFQRRLRRFHQRPDAARAEARLAAGRPDTLPERLHTLLDDTGITAPVAFYDHHTTHAATAYYGLRDHPDRPYLVLTCDGFGDGACATVSVWRDGQQEEIARTGMRDSPGLLYFWATHAYGFTPHEDEYKLMGMAPYADPDRAGQVAELLRQHLWLDSSGLRFQRTGGPSIERSWPRIEARLRNRRRRSAAEGDFWTHDRLKPQVSVLCSGLGRENHWTHDQLRLRLLTCRLATRVWTRARSDSYPTKL